ncbi:uncharacterized protein DUF4265 [Naumannella halotolerans]|uniref:Uncharacterized protein DUF4265 n=1 Tax=Naumannella halotolerans TaxID=993414 RepID=A0A4R7J4R2_9ACTN|nr:uncharacterized protein DUF4265 [Naumannella halotolerans]
MACGVVAKLSNKEATHSSPIWRDRSNFIIAAKFQIDDETFTEQLWARQIDEYTFEVCCIPFLVYDLALGDVVETNHEYVVKRVLSRSGRYVFRVIFAGTNAFNSDRVVFALLELGALIEYSSSNVISVDCVPSRAQDVAKILSAEEQAERLIYETGKKVQD